MKIKNRILICVLVLFVLPVHASLDKTTADWLDKLDASLAKRSYFEKQRIDRIQNLKDGMAKAQAEGREFAQTYALFDEYKSYRYDSARHYAYVCLDIATRQHQDQEIAQAKLAIAFSLISAGILSESLDIIKTIDKTQLSSGLLKDYYEINSQLWRSMADYVKEDPFYTKYITWSNAYLDSVKQVVPSNSCIWWSVTGSRQMRDHEYQKALASFENVLNGCGNDLHLRAKTMAEMAWAHIWLEHEDKAIVYFAQSAIADNETATREITALYHLSRLIFKKGEHERASIYVHQALEDVNFYGTRLRKVEINDILPIIEQDRYDMMRGQRNWLFVVSGLFIILLLACLWSYRTIRRKNQKLTEARETIAGQLEQLKRSNLQLQEDAKIKNAYIGRSFYTNAEFITKLEKLYMAIDRKIATRQYEDLRSMMKLSNLNSERENMYEAFDQTFLKLFPDFVERYNALFEESERKMPPNKHSLTSEMRIFALIRLGINESERIAKFLDYSVHTVNTYKTRIKNRSLIDNEQFESVIMEI
ncbi:DUF6377 domain-containing protein [Prevotella sp. P6B4]|uniref:DUF6377 domain-containing protein n=1 Tax=Prevotella sp. P6B4 TaxID=1410614 RepID=UPI00048D7E6A|nr:DUF6377 domain-containing protein [Prevotella sp. P6B4]